jgi:hypothetical protein
VIARIFPNQKQFVADYISLFELKADDFPSGPYPTDTLRYVGEDVVEYQTPPRAEGLGTFSWLERSERPISGAAVLVGPAPDLMHLAVRLPKELESLTAAIVGQFELDAPRIQ